MPHKLGQNMWTGLTTSSVPFITFVLETLTTNQIVVCFLTFHLHRVLHTWHDCKRTCFMVTIFYVFGQRNISQLDYPYNTNQHFCQFNDLRGLFILPHLVQTVVSDANPENAFLFFLSFFNMVCRKNNVQVFCCLVYLFDPTSAPLLPWDHLNVSVKLLRKMWINLSLPPPSPSLH